MGDAATTETTEPGAEAAGAPAPAASSVAHPLAPFLAGEQRAAIGGGVELRAAGDLPKIDGHAFVYGKWSDDLGGFRERILPGAADESLSNNDDVRALFNHDPNFLLGRRSAGTVELEDQKKGLRYLIDPPQTPTIRDLVLGPMQRNELNQSSFQFIPTKDEWREPKDAVVKDGLWERDLIAFRLIDVSPVTFPAYPQTDVGLRTRIVRELGIPMEALTDLLARARFGPPSERDASLLRDAAAVASADPAHIPSPADPAWTERMKGLIR